MAGAIWGQVNLSGNRIKESIVTSAEQTMNVYKIDRIDHIFEENVYFSCAHQHVIAGAEKEILPLYDKDRNVYFTADCILDNREEVLALLKKENADITDGALAFLAYLTWGEEFVKRLVGIFSFAVYEKNKGEVLIYTDHTGSRCINYCKKEKAVMFSTTMGPLLEMLGKQQVSLSEKWLAACEAFRAPDMIIFPGLTPFEGIYQVEAGHYVKFTEKETIKTRYWNPAKEVKKIRLKSDDEYKQLFLDTFRDCVKSMLRSSGKTAMTLSSGLDSSAVACLAAPMLAEQGETLHTYTSVPLPDFVCEEGYALMNESAGPKLIAAKYPNVVNHFVSCEEKTAFSELERFVEYTELPGKSNANLVWLDDIYEQACKEGCKLVLKGQFGNSTISYGAILSLVYQRLLKLDISGAKAATTAFMRRRRVSKENVLRVAKEALKEKWLPDLSMVEESFVRQELFCKYGIKREIRSMLKKGGGSLMDSENAHKNFMTEPRILQHLGMYDTKIGLAQGVIIRDPTKDKRLIELCMALPMECFVSDGIERRLVRKFMAGIVPAEIRTDVGHRGLQSADFVFRLNKQWLKYKQEIICLLEDDRLYQMLDKNKLQALVARLKRAEAIEDKAMAQDVTVLVSLGLFLKKYSR